MCTVSFIPAGDQVFITSNRDEKHTRGKAIPPAVYYYDSISLLYPKDKDAGGTWIAAKQNGDVGVLLNGAFQFHISAPPYKKSRGLVLLEVLQNENSLSFFSDYDCKGIEPFTLVLYENKQLYECLWDGEEKFIKELHAHLSYIWSSVTLYSEETTNKRKRWFDEWQMKNRQPKQKDIMRFHRFTGDGDETNDLFMNRDYKTFTVSITCVAVDDKKTLMLYWDALENKEYQENLFVENQPANVA